MKADEPHTIEKFECIICGSYDVEANFSLCNACEQEEKINNQPNQTQTPKSKSYDDYQRQPNNNAQCKR